jgi:alpha-tubulin suppressor-like RCC1 family protein
MSEAILGLKRSSENETDAKDVLYNMMIEDGYSSANSEMTVDDLIALLDDSNIKLDEIEQIACGYTHTFILKNDGSIWSCGFNNNGQLGLGNTTKRTTFTQVPRGF